MELKAGQVKADRTVQAQEARAEDLRKQIARLSSSLIRPARTKKPKSK